MKNTTYHCHDCEWQGTHEELGKDDGGNILYCPKCESMYLIAPLIIVNNSILNKHKHLPQTRSQFHLVYQAYKKEKNKFINKLNRLGGVSTLQPNPYN